MAVRWNKNHNDVHMWKVVNRQGKTATGFHPRHLEVSPLTNLFSSEAFAIAALFTDYIAVRM